MPHSTRKRVARAFAALCNKTVERRSQARQHPTVRRQDMFKKILIANRGEIACRVIKTAKIHGDFHVSPSIRTPTAMHCMSRWPTRRCTSARRRRARSYIVIDRIIEAIRADRGRGGASGLWLSVGTPPKFAAALAKPKASLSSARPSARSRRWATRSPPRSSRPRPACPRCPAIWV